MLLQSKVAIITGGGTGIGLGCAKCFAAEGCAVVVTGRREEPLRQAVKEIRDAGGKAEYRVCDVSCQAQAEKLVNGTIEARGKLDILLNNAGQFFMGKESMDFSADIYEQAIKVNFLGTLYCCQAAVRHMKKSGGGAIINVTSVSAHFPHRNQAPYNASKAATEMLSKIMALELGKYNIRVNTICPSLTRTDMIQGHLDLFGEDAMAADHPLGRLGEPMDIAHGALYLASGQSSWVTGNSLFIDGGCGSKC